MRKCDGVTRTRAPTQFVELLMPVELSLGGGGEGGGKKGRGSYARSNHKNEPYLPLWLQDPPPLNASIGRGNDPLNFVCASVFELRVSALLRARLRGQRDCNDTLNGSLGKYGIDCSQCNTRHFDSNFTWYLNDCCGALSAKFKFRI